MNYSINITDIAEEDILTTARYINNILKNSTAANNPLLHRFSIVIPLSIS